MINKRRVTLDLPYFVSIERIVLFLSCSGEQELPANPDPGTTHSRGRVRRTVDDRSRTRDERTNRRTDTKNAPRANRSPARAESHWLGCCVARQLWPRRVSLDREGERSMQGKKERQRRVGNLCRGGCKALPSNPSIVEAYRVPRASTIISVRQRCPAPQTIQRDEVPRALLYLRGVIESIQQYWFRAAKRSAILKNAQYMDPLWLRVPSLPEGSWHSRSYFLRSQFLNKDLSFCSSSSKFDVNRIVHRITHWVYRISTSHEIEACKI